MQTIIIAEVSNQIQSNHIAWAKPLAQAEFSEITPEVIQWVKLIANNIWHQWCESDDANGGNHSSYNSIIIHDGEEIL